MNFVSAKVENVLLGIRSVTGTFEKAWNKIESTTESSRLEETFRVIESNHHRTVIITSKGDPQMSHVVISCTLTEMVIPQPP